MAAQLRVLEGGADDIEWRPTRLPNLQVAVHDGSIFVRDPEYPREMLVYTKDEWRAFMDGAKDGEFDDLTEEP